MLPRGEEVRRAVAWVSDRKRAEPERRFSDFANEATLRFDLNPLQAEALLRFFRDADASGTPPDELDTDESG